MVFIDSQTSVDCETTSQHLEHRTRERVLAVVSEHGPVTAAAIGSRLGLTPAAVRRHLDALAEQGAVVEHDPLTGQAGQTRGRGRPARSFVISEAGHEALPSDYDGLATEALHFLEDAAGPEAVAAFARQRVAGVEARYAAQLATAGHDPARRADALVTALTEDGFAASARPVGTGSLAGVQLCQGHCPVKHVAEQFPAFCDAETDAFSRLLGVHVQRLATLAAGHRVCTTFIPTAAAASATADAEAGQPAPGTLRRRRDLDQKAPPSTRTRTAARAPRTSTTTGTAPHTAPTQERSSR